MAMQHLSVRNPLAEILIVFACVGLGLLFGPWWGLALLASLDVFSELRG